MNRLLAIIALILMISCEEGPRGYNYERGSLPDKPVNLVDFNSEFDDYNSTAPSLGSLIPFCFSTNRKSQGDNFDVIYEPMNVNFDKTSGILTVTNKYSNWSVFQDDYAGIMNGLTKINTTGNEFGPYLIGDHYNDPSDYDFIIMYASDINGDFQINYTFNNDNSDFSESSPVEFLNTESNDLYPTFNSDYSKIYFCSDREDEKFNIFYVNVDNSNTGIVAILADTNFHEVIKDDILSSDYDDKCPFVFQNTLVFTSNRPGGFGGYDLYFSRFENSNWTTPLNMGSKINTESDEYRPILFEEEVDFEKYMMVFSSDREGGKGGFDLYYVGVTKE